MAHEAFREMDHFQEFHQLVCSGLGPEKIAKKMHEEWDERTDIKRDSLIRAIYRYKKDVPANQLADGGVPDYVKRRLDDFAGEVDEVEELTKLYRLQVRRIMLAYNQEDEIGFLQKYTRKELEEARNLIMALAELKIKLGVLDAEPDKFELSVSSKGVLEAVSEDEERQLARVSAQVMQALMQPRASLPAADDDVVEADFELED